MALRLGLARQAVEEILLRAPATVLGLNGMKLELELLLALGRAEDVRTILNDESVMARKARLPFYDLPAPAGPGGAPLYPVPYHWPAYEWLRLLQAAGVGDYGKALAAVRALRAGFQAELEGLKRQRHRLEGSAGAFVPGLLAGPLPFLPAFTAVSLARLEEQGSALRLQEQFLPAEQADLSVLEGLLALEEGGTEDARSALVEALRTGAATSFAGQPIAAGYLQKGLGRTR
jgi:hypothetical protein